jgi:hypothetical protein
MRKIITGTSPSCATNEEYHTARVEVHRVKVLPVVPLDNEDSAGQSYVFRASDFGAWA